MRSLVWFRSDLRLHDNTALAAARAAGEVVALFIAMPAQWEMHDDAPIKRDYWRRNLQLLEAGLSALGVPLVFAQAPRYADIPALFDTLLPVLGVQAVHCNREYAINERRRDASVATVCERQAVRFAIHEDQCLTTPAQLLNKSGAPFKVFTPYSRTARALLQEYPPVARPVPERQDRPALASHAALRPLQSLNWPSVDPAWERLWPAGEDHARECLVQFCREHMADYQARRDFPAVSGTSKLSHMLAAGVLSVRECWRESLAWGNSQGMLTWQNELLWRDFYRSVMWHWPHVCRHEAWRHDVGHVPWRHDDADFEQWCEGRTGVPVVDAAMRQLVQTGWMHNRLRMITAMFLSKHLLLDWRWGERFFMRHLIDGDFASNNGGWQWSASTGTDAAPYFRIFNPVTQSRRFDPEGTFIRSWIPELADLDDDAVHDPGLFRPAGYPEPMLELAFGRERALNAFKG